MTNHALARQWPFADAVYSIAVGSPQNIILQYLFHFFSLFLFVFVSTVSLCRFNYVFQRLMHNKAFIHSRYYVFPRSHHHDCIHFVICSYYIFFVVAHFLFFFLVSFQSFRIWRNWKKIYIWNMKKKR